ncbi:AAA domain-containing protein [Arcticibacter tournemirensis]|uniref:AAA family ATPase n=1 Tax=Arcticibacter tournemirensis TaxID=699437 RepID=A0A5M9GIN6_9SPHI|nr:AAA family ATPase [Arcticibacter tournemirensis]KAA8473615.1 AAA family ATPase [Arcticibacter tournemirensis]TQM51737.1 AAA domain-containing protein [Arcticibacter tournemirensis]
MSQLLKSEIITWLKLQPYWLQYAGSLLLDGTQLTDTLKSDIYSLFLEDNDLKSQPAVAREAVVFTTPTIPMVAASTPKLLSGIKDVENVNALATGQQLPIGPGLTIVYGNNGSGKSGYIRLLNNAFNSRGDKHIIHNIYGGKPASATGKFMFTDAASTVELKYPDDKDKVEFTQFSIFDTHCLKAQLEQDNKLSFTPSGFQFFDQLLEVYGYLKDTLSADTAKNRPANTLLSLFINENVIKEKIAGLSGRSKPEEFKELGIFGDEEIKKLERLNAEKVALQSLNIAKRIADLQLLNGRFKELVAMLENIISALNKATYDSYRQLLTENQGYLAISQAEGLTSFEQYEIVALGSKEWKAFLTAAQVYSVQAKQELGDNCLLCLRPLGEPEAKLIATYWNFLRSVAEENFKKSNDEINAAIDKLKTVQFPAFDETSTVFAYIKENKPELAATWQKNLKDLTSIKQELLQMLETKNVNAAYMSLTVDSADFDQLLKDITIKIDDLLTKDTSAELESYNNEIILLNDKNLLSRVLDQVEKYIKRHAWADKADAVLSILRTNALTTKQGELFTKYITSRYTDLFNEECEKLKAPNVVNIQQRNAKGQTLRKLQVSGYVANQILSEGEQRAICIADFLTEVQMNPNNTGVVFDDPVSSLDHERKERIARRLVEFSATNQVVIFTHDIAFYLRMKTRAEEAGLDCTLVSIRRHADATGVIFKDIPWPATGVKQRLGFLRNMLVGIKKIDTSADSDKYLMSIKNWYMLLRETWERMVEEKVLNGVVERFSPGVSTQRLKKINITPSILAEVESGMTESSSWVHDAAANLNPTIPDTAKAEQDLLQLENFNKTFK